MKKASWTQKTHLFKADEYICSACGVSWVDEAEALSAILDDDW